MLPTTPLHHLLSRGFGRPLVCTSGNRSGEPLARTDAELEARLAGVYDLALTHDREVTRVMDDSVVQVSRGLPRVLRRARGYAPRPLPFPWSGPPLLALGARQKSAPALAAEGMAVPGAHVGDLGSRASEELLESRARDLVEMFGCRPGLVLHDLHPDLESSRVARSLAREWGVEARGVQHHQAHVAACLLEHGHAGSALGLAWDGVGYGEGGEAWGGEWLELDGAGFRRLASLRRFRLPGGDAAARSPRRVALALLAEVAPARVEAFAAAHFSEDRGPVLLDMVRRGVRSPWTSSMGRLFDGVACLLGLRDDCDHEGQAACELEALARRGRPGRIELELPLSSEAPARADWGQVVESMASAGADPDRRADLALAFHLALADLARRAASRADHETVCLTGGCFQNGLLLEAAAASLEAAGHRVLIPEEVPVNDGGVAVGQLRVGAAELGEVL